MPRAGWQILLSPKAPSRPWSPLLRARRCGRMVEPARLGRISECAVVFTLEVFGFPIFKHRASSADVDKGAVFRGLMQAGGHLSVAAAVDDHLARGGGQQLDRVDLSEGRNWPEN